MANKTVTVKDSGGDYTSLNSALSGESADLVTNTCILTIECYELSSPNSVADTGTGYTTNASYYINIVVPAAERHNGKEGNGYQISVTGTYCIVIREGYTRVTGVSMAGATTAGIYLGATGILVNKCLLHDMSGKGIEWNSGTGIEIRNTIGYDLGVYGAIGSSADTDAVTCNNCTMVRQGADGDAAGCAYRYVKAVNCIGMHWGPTGGYADFLNLDAGSGYNCSHDASGDDVGSGNLINKTAANTFVAPASDATADYHLKTGSDCINAATDLSGSFTDDIDGDTRSDWDIGADEYVSALTHYTLTSASGSYTLSGKAASLLAARKLASASGSYSLTGNAASLLASRKVSASYGSFALTGNATSLRADRKLTAEDGEFALTGNAATLLAARRIAADSGTYLLTGNGASLRADRKLLASFGEFILSGQPASLNWSGSLNAYTLTAETGVYVLSGQAARLLFGHRLVSDSGQFTLSGQTAALLHGRRLVGEAGEYVLTGEDADFWRTYVLDSETGVFLLSGKSAGLIYSGAAGPSAYWHEIGNIRRTAAGLESKRHRTRIGR